MRYGGKLSAINAYFFLAIATLAEPVKPKYDNYSSVMRYGGNFSAVNVFQLLTVITLAETVKPKHRGDYSAVMPYDGFRR